MKSLRNVFGAALVCLTWFVPALLSAQASDARKSWSEVTPPVLQSYAIKADDPTKLVLVFNSVTGVDGADRIVVDLMGSAGTVIESKTLGRSKNDVKTVEFAPSKSDSYRARVTAFRTGEPQGKTLEVPAQVFSLPLGTPQIGTRNLGNGQVLVTWAAIPEAETYEVSWTDPAGAKKSMAGIPGLSATLENLSVGTLYTITVAAVRGSDRTVSAPFSKRVKKEVERVWNFTWFGQSSNGAVNRFQMLDSNDLKFQLFSATVKPDGQIDLKGGKFTTFHDGVSFYYTTIDPRTENFVLTATFTIDFINPTPDGQEGFGLLAMDSLGAHGVNSVNHYTNSAGIIATKFEATIDGVKKSSKDTLGARFVSGITPEVLALGDSGIAQNALNVSRAFSYETADLAQKGKSYTLTLKKTNTGYSVVYPSSVPGDPPIEHILYGTDKLAKLDPAHDYVGFAVARGCNATVSNVSLVITDPKTDPPAQEEPPLLTPLSYKVDSPTATGLTDYPFVFTANADGKLTVTQRTTGKKLADQVALKAGVDFVKTTTIVKGQNDFDVVFTLDPTYSPAPRTKMGIPEAGSTTLVQASGSYSLVHTVYHRTFDGPVINVGPTASSLGLGTPERPVSLGIALSFVRPGQTVLLSEGTYFLRNATIIERGNDGTEKQRKVLKAAPGERPVLDYTYATGAFQLWGSWWLLEGFDVTHSPGDVSGVQIAGHQNIARNIHTYENGGTGLQISGTSREEKPKWPRNNLVESCTSWGNNDPAQNNADGFAAKITTGAGNVFRYCMAYNNIDDGWDLFSKIESGPIDPVLIENSVAYRNGSLPDGSGNGDGNGFKLGGDGIAVAHILRNCIAFDNGANGITSNSDPAIILVNNTSFGNKASNINLYGKGSGPRLFQVSNVISMAGASPDIYNEMPQLASPTNYFWTGAQAMNSEKAVLTKDIFVQTDVKIVPERRADGTIDMKGLLVLNEKAPKGIGSTLK